LDNSQPIIPKGINFFLKNSFLWIKVQRLDVGGHFPHPKKHPLFLKKEDGKGGGR